MNIYVPVKVLAGLPQFHVGKAQYVGFRENQEVTTVCIVRIEII